VPLGAGSLTVDPPDSNHYASDITRDTEPVKLASPILFSLVSNLGRTLG